MANEPIGKFFDRAMQCETPEQAQAFMAAEIADFQKLYGYGADQARSIILHNLGYMAGYYDHATAVKVKQLFGANHPVFGSPENFPKTPEEAFKAGVEWGKTKGGDTHAK